MIASPLQKCSLPVLPMYITNVLNVILTRSSAPSRQLASAHTEWYKVHDKKYWSFLSQPIFQTYVRVWIKVLQKGACPLPCAHGDEQQINPTLFRVRVRPPIENARTTICNTPNQWYRDHEHSQWLTNQNVPCKWMGHSRWLQPIRSVHSIKLANQCVSD